MQYPQGAISQTTCFLHKKDNFPLSIIVRSNNPCPSYGAQKDSLGRRPKVILNLIEIGLSDVNEPIMSSMI